MIRLEHHLQDIASPANLRINDQINAFRERCRQGVPCHSCVLPSLSVVHQI